MISKMEKVFDSLSEVMEAALVKGMDRDSLHILQKRISDMDDMSANKYAKVFMSMA